MVVVTALLPGVLFVFWVTVIISLPVIRAAGMPVAGIAVFGIAVPTNFLNKRPSAPSAVTFATLTPAATPVG